MPLVPTLIVAAAVATMIALGAWQIRRAAWKEELLARYEAAAGLPAIAYPNASAARDALAYRRAAALCLEPLSRTTTAGRSARGKSGWSHIVSCRAGAGGRARMAVDIGWSERHDAAVDWRGGAVEGVLAPVKGGHPRLVSTRPAPGLEPSEAPGPDAIANNHRLYAAQWFFFAGLAALIYWLALRKRRNKPDTP